MTLTPILLLEDAGKGFQRSGVCGGVGSACASEAACGAVAVGEVDGADRGTGATAPCGAGAMTVEPFAGGRIEGDGASAGGIGGIEGCVSPGSSVILPLCKDLSS
jgi:hypothetical protein